MARNPVLDAYGGFLKTNFPGSRVTEIGLNGDDDDEKKKRGTSLPAGWQQYADLMQSGKVGEGFQRALEGSGPVTESPSLLESMNLEEGFEGCKVA